MIRSVWHTLRALLVEGPERRGRRLARDAEQVARNARESYRPELVATIAERIRANLAAARAALEAAPEVRDAMLGRMRAQHREALRGNDPVALTSWTLVIVHTEASALGDAGLPAIAAVERFVADVVAAAQAPRRGDSPGGDGCGGAPGAQVP